jgi:spore germination protein
MGFQNRRGSKEKKEILFTYEPDTKTLVSSTLNENIQMLKKSFQDSNDMVFREFKVGGPDGVDMFLCYIDGLADKMLVNDFVLTPIMITSRIPKPEVEEIKDSLSQAIKDAAMSAGDFKEVDYIEEALIAILSGETALFIDGYDKSIIVATRSWPARGPSEPTAETVIRGPRDGFVETIRFNTALVRRRIRDPRFKVKQTQVGERSKTDIAILYIDDIVDKKIVEDVERKLKEINIDAVIDSGYIEEFIQEKRYTTFPQIQITERPDVVAAAVYEGRVAIIVDNSPFVLIVPATLTTFFQSAEDYYTRPITASFLRTIRVVSGILSLIGPSLYIALVSFHPGIIPTKLALSIAASREGVPFPAFIEAIIMELTFELLREAGVRLPRPIGSTIGIVGGLVIGQAAVTAGFVSPIMVIVVAVTAIASFAIPNYEVATGFRLIRFVLMILSSIYGLYGVLLGAIATLIHLVNLKSFGTPFLTPVAPFVSGDIKDGMLYRASWKNMKTRPKSFSPNDEIRQGGKKDDSR